MCSSLLYVTEIIGCSKLHQAINICYNYLNVFDRLPCLIACKESHLIPLYILSLPETLSLKWKIKHFKMQTFLTILRYSCHAVKYTLSSGFLHSASLPPATAHHCCHRRYGSGAEWGGQHSFLITPYSLQGIYVTAHSRSCEIQRWGREPPMPGHRCQKDLWPTKSCWPSCGVPWRWQQENHRMA